MVMGQRPLRHLIEITIISGALPQLQPGGLSLVSGGVHKACAHFGTRFEEDYEELAAAGIRIAVF